MSNKPSEVSVTVTRKGDSCIINLNGLDVVLDVNITNNNLTITWIKKNRVWVVKKEELQRMVDGKTLPLSSEVVKSGHTPTI